MNLGFRSLASLLHVFTGKFKQPLEVRAPPQIPGITQAPHRSQGLRGMRLSKLSSGSLGQSEKAVARRRRRNVIAAESRRRNRSL